MNLQRELKVKAGRDTAPLAMRSSGTHLEIKLWSFSIWNRFIVWVHLHINFTLGSEQHIKACKR